MIDLMVKGKVDEKMQGWIGHVCRLVKQREERGGSVLKKPELRVCAVLVGGDVGMEPMRFSLSCADVPMPWRLCV